MSIEEMEDKYFLRLLVRTPEEHQNLIKKFLGDAFKRKEEKVIEQKECSTCLNPILLGQKTNIDRSGVERHKTCAMGFYK